MINAQHKTKRVFFEERDFLFTSTASSSELILRSNFGGGSRAHVWPIDTGKTFAPQDYFLENEKKRM